jgi:hypothetical protein
MNGRRCALVGGALAAALLAALLVEPALAQTSDVGRNVGREVRTWATAGSCWCCS